MVTMQALTNQERFKNGIILQKDPTDTSDEVKVDELMKELDLELYQYYIF